MEKIAAGKGPGPKPFVMAKWSRAPANAEWKSHRATTSASEAKKNGPVP
jgi:hypothetical protein